jgi:hypothetical protein
MTKEQYKAFVRAHKNQDHREIKLVNLLINYRSFNTHSRYPQGMYRTLMECRKGQKMLNYGGVWHFNVLTSRGYDQPSFYAARFGNCLRANRDNDNPEIPF